MTIAYYVSGHGLGHSVRAIEIMRRLDAGIPLFIVTGAPEWFFRQELRRPFNFRSDRFDCGALEGEDSTIDRGKTLKTYAAIAEENARRLNAEAGWLRQIGARLAVSDVPSFPLAAAREAGVPGLVVANFSWAEIYRPYLEDFPAYRSMVEAMEAEYALADLAIVTPPIMAMPAFERVLRVPLVARRGVERRAEIAEAYGLDPDCRWFLFYPGNLGMAFDLETLRKFGDTVFLTFSGVPNDRLPNLIRLEQGRFRHEDVLASADGAVAKAGYGMVGECMANGTPLLYTGRDHFAEYEALDRALQAWGGAVRIPQADFAAGRWAEALDKMATLRPKPIEDADGAEAVAKELIRWLEDKR